MIQHLHSIIFELPPICCEPDVVMTVVGDTVFGAQYVVVLKYLLLLTTILMTTTIMMSTTVPATAPPTVDP